MSKDNKAVKAGPFKGMTITFAPTERIEEFNQVATGFMAKIFDLRPGEYAISDESDVRDFMERGSSDSSDIWKRIQNSYGIAFRDVGSGRLVAIFTEIARRRNPQ